MDLILNTFGTTLTKDTDNFVVIHKDGKQRIHPKEVNSISISKGAKITSDAAILAIENEIDVYFIEKGGNPIGRIWSNKYGSISSIRKNQLDFCFSSSALEWIKTIQMQKIENQQALLLTVITEEHLEKELSKAINKLEDYRKKISLLEGEIVSDIASTLRGWEGAASKVYFNLLNKSLPEAYQFDSRSQHPAMDIFNCMLNYAYGVLYGKIEGALIKAGIDPYVGVFHRDDYNRPVLVYDIIEIYRVWVDFVVVALSKQEVINSDMYTVKEDGSYWLESLGKRILIQSLTDYFDEVINQKGISRSRITHLNNYAQDLAQQFLKFKGR